MEKLSQKYAKHFYITLLIVLIAQLFDAVYVILKEGIQIQSFVLIIISIINIILVINSMKYNIKQRFIECKINTKILRITMGILLILHSICRGVNGCSVLMLSYPLSNLVIIELVLSYRIRSIEHLELLARKNKEIKQYIENLG